MLVSGGPIQWSTSAFVPGRLPSKPDGRQLAGMERSEPGPDRWTGRALVAHSGGLRRLARRLVFSDADARDVVEQTYATALQRDPPLDARRGPWLRAIARNVALALRREHARRRRRERMAAKPEKLPSTADLVIRLEEKRLVVDTWRDPLSVAPRARVTDLRRFESGLRRAGTQWISPPAAG